MRKKANELEVEASMAEAQPPTMVVENPGDIVDRTTPLVDQTPMLQAKAPMHVVKQTPDELAQTKPKVYQVRKGGRACVGGGVTQLYVGKLVSEQHYNISHLLQQGIELEQVE